MRSRLLQNIQPEMKIDAQCPDFDRCKQICKAAIRCMIPSRRDQMRYCATYDYDNCPIYLGKALRSSRSQGLDHESIIDSGKSR